MVALIGGLYVIWPRMTTNTVVGYFASAAGVYPGDEVRVVGVPVGSIESISPQADTVKITMRVKDSVKVPADARAVIIAPNLVAARFIQLTPAYKQGPEMEDGGSIGLDRTAVPVEWDDVKTELTRLSQQLGPSAGQVQGPLSEFVNQAADTFDGNGDSFRQALRELSQTAGRLGDSSTDLFGTVKNLQILVDALSKSNEQIVQFSGHLASVSQVLADSTVGLDDTLGSLSQALSDVRGFLDENNETLIGNINRLTDFTSILTNQTDDVEQILHVRPNAMANFYNIYNPAQGTANGLLGLPKFDNPVQFICGNFDVGGDPRQLQASRDLPPADGSGAQAPRDELPAVHGPPDQQHHRLQGPDHLRHPGDRGQGADPLPYLQWIPRRGVTPPQRPGSRPARCCCRRPASRSAAAGAAVLAGRRHTPPGPAAAPADPQRTAAPGRFRRCRIGGGG